MFPQLLIEFKRQIYDHLVESSWLSSLRVNDRVHKSFTALLLSRSTHLRADELCPPTFYGVRRPAEVRKVSLVDEIKYPVMVTFQPRCAWDYKGMMFNCLSGVKDI